MKIFKNSKIKLTLKGKEIVDAKLYFLFYDAHEKLRPYDRIFVASIIKQFKANPALSIKQLNKLDEIYERIAPAYAIETRVNDYPLSPKI